MNQMQLRLPTGKAEFNFTEAAALLGLTSGQLEALVVTHLAGDDSTPANIARMRFRPADLIMLNMVQSADSPLAAG